MHSIYRFRRKDFQMVMRLYNMLRIQECNHIQELVRKMHLFFDMKFLFIQCTKQCSSAVVVRWNGYSSETFQKLKIYVYILDFCFGRISVFSIVLLFFYLNSAFEFWFIFIQYQNIVSSLIVFWFHFLF